MISCPTPGCGAVLRRVDGIHSAGDAPLVHGPRGEVNVLCPKCKKLVPWPVQRPDMSDDGGDAT